MEVPKIEITEEQMKDFVRQIERRNEDSAAFFKSGEFNNLLAIIKQHECIDNEDLVYRVRQIDGLSAEDFKRVCEAVFYNLGELNEQFVRDQTSRFSKYYVDYQGLRFHLMIGQGSVYRTTRQ